jgi:Pathogenicity locus
MKMMTKKEVILRNLQTIPGIGKAMSVDLWNIGIKNVGALKGKSPTKLYKKTKQIYRR